MDANRLPLRRAFGRVPEFVVEPNGSIASQLGIR